MSKSDSISGLQELQSIVESCHCSRTLLGVVEHLSKQHPTHQQNFTRLCVSWLQHLANFPSEHRDGRNDASVKLARKCIRTIPFEDMVLPYV